MCSSSPLETTKKSRKKTGPRSNSLLHAPPYTPPSPLLYAQAVADVKGLADLEYFRLIFWICEIFWRRLVAPRFLHAELRPSGMVWRGVLHPPHTPLHARVHQGAFVS